MIGGVAIVAYWSEIVDWLKDFLPKLKGFWDTYKSNLPHAAIIAGDFVFEQGTKLARIMHKLYYKEGDQWMLQTTTRKCDEAEVPAVIKNKMNRNREADITEEIEEETGLEV